MGFFPSFHEDKGREISMSNLRITDLPTPNPSQEGNNQVVRVDFVVSAQSND